ncbi:hypothetical protein Y032_0008g154 [Ancylostoma ceylanicum]|uniref:Uncharacterized protein n=1 Tax=Ancylostoma ceylanicum TaxID=53326 RepID=A0A016VLU2_9BILA|nr:hypothetical protein Y032_0008g154 [Ancylostoma ceylanicum]
MPATRKTTYSTRTVKAHSQPVTSNAPVPVHQESDKDQVILALQSILANKAPEALPLLNQLIQLFRPNPREIIESEKRARSIVIAGIAEAEGEPIDRLAHTEAETCKVLSALGVEARPTEIYRMGDYTEGRARVNAFDVSLHKPLLRSSAEVPGLGTMLLGRSKAGEHPPKFTPGVRTRSKRRLSVRP